MQFRSVVGGYWLCGVIVLVVLVGRIAATPVWSQSALVPRAFLPVVINRMDAGQSAAPKPTPMPGPTPTVAPTPQPTDTIRNGGFEDGAMGWTERSTQGYDVIVGAPRAPVAAHDGTGLAWLGGAPDETTSIAQRVVLPAEGRFLTYWVWIASEDVCGYDVGSVTIGYDDVTEQPESYALCERANTFGWVRHVVDLGPYAGRTVDIEIRATVDTSINSNLFVDDVAISAQAD